MNYNIFGSANSQDYDIMVFINAIPAIQECKELCARLEVELSAKFSDKKCNVNLAVVSDGVIIDVFKGTPDECNNSIYQTYVLHSQDHPLPITKKVKRNVKVKIARSLRIMLSFLSRTEHRALIKQAMRGTTEDKLQALTKIEFVSIVDLGKNNQDVIEFYKHAAFQIGQTLILMEGQEIYSKDEICDQVTDLSDYVLRKPSDGKQLDRYKFILIEEIRQRYKDLTCIHE